MKVPQRTYQGYDYKRTSADTANFLLANRRTSLVTPNLSLRLLHHKFKPKLRNTTGCNKLRKLLQFRKIGFNSQFSSRYSSSLSKTTCMDNFGTIYFWKSAYTLDSNRKQSKECDTELSYLRVQNQKLTNKQVDRISPTRPSVVQLLQLFEILHGGSSKTATLRQKHWWNYEHDSKTGLKYDFHKFAPFPSGKNFSIHL